MALLCRVKLVRLNYISYHLKSCYFQTLVSHRAAEYSHHYTMNHAIYRRPTDHFSNWVRSFAAPVQVKKEEVKSASGVKLNEQIKAEFVRLVTDEGHLVVARHEALRRAKNLKLDLVEVDRHAKPPVCKIMDYHKERYKQQVKEKERTKIMSEGSIKKGDSKEVRFSGKTELKDLKMKADMAKRLMERGYRVKCMAMGTEDQDLAGLLSQLSAMIEDCAFVESGPRVEKKQAYIIVRHVKFGPSKKGAKKGSKVDDGTRSETQNNDNAFSQNPVDSEEKRCSEDYAMDNDDVRQKETARYANCHFDKMFDLSHEMNGISSSAEKQMKFDPRAASPATNSKATEFASFKASNFKDPIKPSSQEPENRYAKNVTKNTSATRNPVKLPNHGSQSQSHSNFSPTGGPSRAGSEGSIRNFRLPQNEKQGEISKQGRQGEPNSNVAPIGVGKAELPDGDSSRSSTSSGFGIFSATEVNASGKYGAHSGSPSNVPRNLNSPTVKSDGNL